MGLLYSTYSRYHIYHFHPSYDTSEEQDSLWKHLWPSNSIAQKVTKFISSQLGRKYTGIHLRYSITKYYILMRYEEL